MNTVNRRPRLVDTPTSKQIQTQYFHQNEWKGICEDKNTFGVDQNTFAECENVYVNRDNFLCNRPGLNDELLDNFNNDNYNGYKIYSTKSYIIYYGQRLVEDVLTDDCKIVDINKSAIEYHTLTVPSIQDSTFVNYEPELYFYEIGNILFAFGNNGLYKLNSETYSLTNVVAGTDETNIYVPFSTDVKNLFIYNNFKVDYKITYERKDDVLLNPQNFNSSALQITSSDSDNIVNNVTVNWPYDVAKLSKSILKNASLLETTDESPSYENLYYIGNKIYTNGGFQKSIEVSKYNSGAEMYIYLYLYDDKGELVRYNGLAAFNYTYRVILRNETLYNYVIVDDFWYKVDYSRSKDNVLGIAICILGRSTAQSTEYRWYMNYVEINFNDGVNSIRDGILALNADYYSANQLDKFIPFCFYYNSDDELSAIGVVSRERSSSGVTDSVSYFYVAEDLLFSLYTRLDLSRSSFIPFASTDTNISTLTSQRYFGRITRNHITNNIAYWTICDIFEYNSTGVDLAARDHSLATNTMILNSDLMNVSFKNNEQLNIFTRYGEYSNELYCTIVSYEYNVQDHSAEIIKEETLASNIKYPSALFTKIYLSYSLYFSNDEIDTPFGAILLSNGEYLSDVYYNSNTGDIILLTTTGKIFSNLSNAQSNIVYKFSAAPNLSYTGQLPTLICPIGSNSFLYFVNDTSYILQVRYNNNILQLYLPEGKENKYYDIVIDAEQTSDRSLAVIGNNVIYSVVDTGEVDDKLLPIFQYIQSKLNLRVIEDSDSIIAYNSSTLLMPTYNGIAAVNYSQLISVEEQTVNYITDNVLSHWFRFIATETGRLKTCNHNYYLLVYHTGRNDLYMFDYRSNTWWYWTFDKNIKLLHTIGLYCFIVFEDNTLHYFDEKILDAHWSVTSQKLFLGNNTNYKQIRRFTVHTVGEKSKDYSYQSGDGDNVMDLQFTNYRKRMYENDDETFNFNVDFVRTYVIRLNYPKVYEFQYKLSSNELNLKPLQLTGITIEYKVGGKVR